MLTHDVPAVVCLQMLCTRRLSSAAPRSLLVLLTKWNSSVVYGVVAASCVHPRFGPGMLGDLLVPSSLAVLFGFSGVAPFWQVDSDMGSLHNVGCLHVNLPETLCDLRC